jgi:glycosyltransferase involved in cell wall biosynthesis
LTFATVLQGWTRRKNPKPAILAFHQIRQEFPDVRLLMIGDGYAPGGEAHTWASEKGIADGVRFLGALPHRELLSVMHREVDVLVHPSLDEAFSLTILEAMTLSKPVIAGRRTPGVLEMTGNAEGLAADVSSPRDLAAEMRKLLQDPSKRQDRGAAGKKRAMTMYSAARVVGMYEEVYSRFAQE